MTPGSQPYFSCPRQQVRKPLPHASVSLCLLLFTVAVACGQVHDGKATAEVVGPMAKSFVAWGSDHVDKELPPYLTGDECLFCHRKIGSSWGDNEHQRTIRPASGQKSLQLLALRDESLAERAEEVEWLLGAGQSANYFLRRSARYGRLEILTALWRSPSAAEDDDLILHTTPPHWDTSVFADRCAGCHATAVDAKTRAFSAISLDCYTCHGDVPLGHTQDIGQVLLSRKNREPRQVTSICGQCHLRGGKSISQGTPYANQFVAGDNLFRDYQVDLTNAAIRALPAVEQHIFRSAREAAAGSSKVSCVDCHRVHQGDVDLHQELAARDLCYSCHQKTEPISDLLDSYTKSRRKATRSVVCGL